MNRNILLELQAVIMGVVVAGDEIENEWANVNDCGAPGPSFEEPELLYQDSGDNQLYSE